MNQQQRSEFVQRFLEKYVQGIMDTKGASYSRGEENSNSNFYRVGEATGDGPVKAAHTYLLKHIDSISNYVKNGAEGDHEAGEHIFTRIADAINYLLIEASILVQEYKVDDPTIGPMVDPPEDQVTLKGDQVRRWEDVKKDTVPDIKGRDLTVQDYVGQTPIAGHWYRTGEGRIVEYDPQPRDNGLSWRVIRENPNDIRFGAGHRFGSIMEVTRR